MKENNPDSFFDCPPVAAAFEYEKEEYVVVVINQKDYEQSLNQGVAPKDARGTKIMSRAQYNQMCGN